ncbi:acetyltransferase [Halococcus salifodinae DSM 8989]|uniref:Acetyltransferase n=2 Tax=Halococcaceae TaxID=1963270 RepID=M0MXT4_9EURY|nr:acetyltransferase [Halococcus salifodinae DSM 8989]
MAPNGPSVWSRTGNRQSSIGTGVYAFERRNSGMKLREATRDDGEAIRRIARDSMEASYSLSPRAIESAITEWYDTDGIATKIDEPDALLLVAEDEGEIRGFSESDLVTDGGNGDLLWLHVDPAYRGEGIGTELFEATREALFDMGASQLRAKVIEDNAEGNDFYEDFDFEMVDTDEVEIDDETYVENIYMKAGTAAADSEPDIAEGPVTTPDGQEMYVNEEEVERGSKGPFFTSYTQPDFGEEHKYGYFCANCETLDNAMDTMGRVKCNDCGNLRKATRWDATYG